jgi:hypothetical protein
MRPGTVVPRPFRAHLSLVARLTEGIAVSAHCGAHAVQLGVADATVETGLIRK